MIIYKVFRANEWADLQSNGQTDGAPIDIADGYIHFSTAEQVEETVQKHFAGEDDLTLLGIDTDSMVPDLRWELSRGGALFPHLYRTLHLSDVVWDKPLPLGKTGHIFPEGWR